MDTITRLFGVFFYFTYSGTVLWLNYAVPQLNEHLASLCQVLRAKHLHFLGNIDTVTFLLSGIIGKITTLQNIVVAFLLHFVKYSSNMGIQ
jgi:hypothetical protein